MQRSILSGVISVAGTKVLTLVIGILTTPILYRLLEPAGVGIYTTVISVFSLFMILVSSGVTDGVRKFIAEEREMDCWEAHVVGFYFRLALLLAGVGAGILALLTWSGVVAWIFGPQYELYFYLLSIMTIVSQFRAYSRRTLMGFGLERYSEPLKVVQRVAFVIVALPLVYVMKDRGLLEIAVAGALVGKIASAAAVAIIGFILIFQRVSLRSLFRPTPEGFPRRKMLAFNSLSIVLILLLMSLYHVDILMLQALADNMQVGYYRAALKLAEFLWFVPLALQTVFVHSTSELWSNDKTEQISELAARTTRYTFLLTAIMALGLAVLANIAVPVYFGSQYNPAIMPLLLLLPGALGFAVARPVLAIAQGKGELKYPIAATGSAAGINLVLNAILIPQFGMHGAAVSTSIGYGLMFVFHLWSARKVGFDPLSDARLGRILATTLLSAPPIFVLAHLLDVRPTLLGVELPLALIIIPLLGLIIFLFFAFALGALDLHEVLDLLTPLPEPLGSTAETLKTNVSEDTMSSDSMQKMMVVAGILLFVSGIGYAFLDPGFGGDSDPAPNMTTQPPASTTPAGTTDSTSLSSTTTEETTPDSTTKPPSTTPPEETTPPSTTPAEETTQSQSSTRTTQSSTTTTTTPPSTTTRTTQPSTTTTPPSTTTRTTQPPSSTTSTTQPSTTTTTAPPSTTTRTTQPPSSTTSTTQPSTTTTTTPSSMTTRTTQLLTTTTTAPLSTTTTGTDMLSMTSTVQFGTSTTTTQPNTTGM
ncbi:Membrane protein involved in the export of O-antigen and teichoic acid [Haladaptatus litoreus]|uniref:Membrane protein involved in the export of O-antigen and teichoic acid n=1 Tax=Haladaptatus litoreus TaxID=553468 RepID=A0A1N7DNP6_9EURY|nr:flippase [Haladaptatus litoreus]SIR77391.1 Membrane protein involved in the export of O-antigen and teichoic acid [Haladaptatus litoreus]